MRTKTGIVAAIIFLATLAPAQAQSIEGGQTWRLGSKKLGVETSAHAKLKQTPNYAGVEGNLRISPRLFDRTYRIFRFRAVSHVKNGTAKNGISLYVGPFRVWSRSQKQGWKWKPAITQVWLNKNRSFFAGGFLLNAGVRAGGTVYGSLKLAANVLGAGIEGKVGSKVWADVTVGLDLVTHRAGVRTKATLLHGWWEADSTVSFRGIMGEFGFHFQPLAVNLDLVIDKASWKRKGWRMVRTWKAWLSLTIARWSCREFKRIYLRW